MAFQHDSGTLYIHYLCTYITDGIKMLSLGFTEKKYTINHVNKEPHNLKTVRCFVYQ